MNVKFLNPFVEATYEVLQVETHIQVQRGPLGLEKEPYRTDDVTVIISLIGRVEGNVFYSLSERTAIALASLIMGETFDKFDSLPQSGIAELGNVITGRASVKLAEAGYEATISTPTMLLGKGSTISTLDYTRLVVPMLCAVPDSNIGSIDIHLALREGSARLFHTIDMPAFDRPAIH
jgi:chemotaxis protein CheX